MPSISTQVKMLNALRHVLLGNSSFAFPRDSSPKPEFTPATTSIPLARATPESVGLSSAEVLQLYRRMSALPLSNVHSLIVLRGGKVISEGYFDPYRKDIWHVTHSLCKSVVATAVGLAINEGLFKLDDKIAPFFPGETGFLLSRRHKAITVRHLLTMRSGLSFNEVIQPVETEWLKGIFSSSVVYEPGETFNYNSMNSYLLAALICRASGKSLMEYLKPRLFEPMGFGPVAWETSPDGIEKGGWGMYMMPEDMAKLGQLYLQNGRWEVDGQTVQLVPESWVKTATVMHTESGHPLAYGMHFWTCHHGKSYTMNGMFGQYVSVFPKQNMVVVLTSGNPILFSESPAYDIFSSFALNCPTSMQPLPEAPGLHATLQRSLHSLRYRTELPTAEQAETRLRNTAHSPRRAERWTVARSVQATSTPAEASTFCGQVWQFPRSNSGILPSIIQSMHHNFSKGIKTFSITQHSSYYTMHWEEGRSTFNLNFAFSGPAMETRIRIGGEVFVVACAGRLTDGEHGTPALIIDVWFLEHSSSRVIKLQHWDDVLQLDMDEQPQFHNAIEGALYQSAAVASPLPTQTPLGEWVLGNDYMNYRITQFCAPRLIGRPLGEELVKPKII